MNCISVRWDGSTRQIAEVGYRTGARSTIPGIRIDDFRNSKFWIHASVPDTAQ